MSYSNSKILAIGLMNGTSMDEIDAALGQISDRFANK